MAMLGVFVMLQAIAAIVSIHPSYPLLFGAKRDYHMTDIVCI